jgi:hypothetical protein
MAAKCTSDEGRATEEVEDTDDPSKAVCTGRGTGTNTYALRFARRVPSEFATDEF